MSRLRFVKMHGLGNDYIYVDCFENRVSDPSSLARLLSPRRTAVGSDGLILILPSQNADCRMEMYNADGSRAKMCGNGIRCVGKYMYESRGACRPVLRVETDSGVRTLEIQARDGKVTAVKVDMGEPEFEGRAIPLLRDGPMIEEKLGIDGEEFLVTCLSVGNPHCVLFVEELEEVDIARLGPRFEHHALFPERVNTEFVQVIDERRLRLRVWERGSGETLACGTGACAAAVAACVTGRSAREVVVELRGGCLEVNWGEDNHVWMTGPAVEVFRGDLDLEEVRACSRV